jgi:FkbM family methyltransferase
MRSLNNLLVPTEHGLMIVNRHEASFAFGVSKSLLDDGVYELREISLLREIIGWLQDDCVLLDVGANIGVHTLEFARACFHKNGRVHAFEPQRVLYYMLVGNVALNSFYNVICHQLAIGRSVGTIQVPTINYGVPTSFGSVELGQCGQREAIGQELHLRDDDERVELATIDSFALTRVDLIKIDVEGMELDVLDGARQTIDRDKPVLFVEHYKSDITILKNWLLSAGYKIYEATWQNWVAVHLDNPSVKINGLPEVSA